ncbi:hypothetical protein FDK21_15935 [Cohaesibacter sp. CAU 1516]|uniref:hypothetical protein n=1 Tax=Cohaesibacter sp. CAU 1516 TaxID=2576038 RepID=UPI0010FE3A9A|nr:hypothetical protein [Cohaesibacter sp. CAU 1516]TLP44285.1 hypothetical protein FDK21_15935 [Cohaesibacter sp. CAU 1516]
MLNPRRAGPQTEIWTLASSHASAQVWSFGAALHHLAFQTPEGRPFHPLAEADWLHGSATPPASGAAHLKTLGGEWPCVPFGSVAADGEHHGFGSNRPWRMIERDQTAITLEIDYPPAHVIRRLERYIRLVPGEAAVDFRLVVEARQACHLPIGLHPIFRMPMKDGKLALSIPASGPAQAAPDCLRPATAALAADCFVDLDDLPLSDQQDLVQLWQTEGRADLFFGDVGQTIRLQWEADKLPHCLLWIAHPAQFDAHQSAPFVGLGVEPIASYFDSNDLQIDRSTGVSLAQGEIWSIDYRLMLM